MSIQEIAKRYFGEVRDEVEMAGYYLGPFTSQYLRAAISISVGFGAAFLMYVIDTIAGTSYIGFGTMLLIGTIFAIYIAWNEVKVQVPANHVAIITFFGRRRTIYLHEGDYWWIGSRFFFGASTQPLPKAKNIAQGAGEEQGYVYIGTRILQIWNDRRSKDIKLTLPARAGSTVTMNLSIEITTIDPMRYAQSDDPILLVSERARAGLRKTLTYFRDTDVSGAKSAVAAVLEGHVVLAAFTNKRVGSYLVGSMVQNLSGKPMYEIIDENTESREVIRLTNAFITRLMQEGNPEMLKAATDSQGGLVIETISIVETLNSVMEEVGTRIKDVIISDAQLSAKVRDASEAAAAEGAQREQQITSADTQAEVMARLAAGKNAAGVTELDQLLAAAADGNPSVKITHVTGSGNNRLVTAAVAGGQQIGGNRP